jgi:hypothetical protein
MVDLGEGATTEVVEGVLQIRAPNAIALLPKITETLTEMGVASGAVHMRENTLEDVFIQLTGRRLRS